MPFRYVALGLSGTRQRWRNATLDHFSRVGALVSRRDWQLGLLCHMLQPHTSSWSATSAPHDVLDAPERLRNFARAPQVPPAGDSETFPQRFFVCDRYWRRRTPEEEAG